MAAIAGAIIRATDSFQTVAVITTPAAFTTAEMRTFVSTLHGGVLMGFGTTYDVALKNRAGTTVLGIGPNTTTVTMAGALTVTGVATIGPVDGTARPLLLQGGDATSGTILKLARGNSEKPGYLASAQNNEMIFASEGDVWLTAGVAADAPLNGGASQFKLTTTTLTLGAIAVSGITTLATSGLATMAGIFSTVAADTSVYVGRAVTSGDRFDVAVRTAGNGIQLQANNFGNTDFSPMLIVGNAVTINSRTGVQTSTAVAAFSSGTIVLTGAVSGVTTLDTTSTITGAGGTIRVSTAAAADASLVITRTVNTATEWFIYAPSGSTDLRFNHTGSGDRLTLTTAGAVSGISSLAGTGAVTGFTSAVFSSTVQGTIFTATSAAGLVLATTSSPASTGTGTTGAITWDASYLYVCTATNTWERVALTGGY